MNTIIRRLVLLLFSAGAFLTSTGALSQPTTTVTPNVLEFPYIEVGARFASSFVISVSGLTFQGGANPYRWQVHVSASIPFDADFDSIPHGGSTYYQYSGSSPSHSKKVYVWFFPLADYPVGPLGVVTNTSQDNGTPIATENVILSNGPLPIQLASFVARKDGADAVRLSWMTLSEINNYGFEVQRSQDGTTFASIPGSLVRGNGTTNQSHAYSYLDVAPSGVISYRLKQIDFDGTLNYSEPVQVTTRTDVKELKPTVFALEPNYPNPFNPSTKIIFSIAEEGPISLRVYDVLGSEVALLVNENRRPGQYTEQFDGSRQASGVYMYVLRSAKGQLVGRMMLSK